MHGMLQGEQGKQSLLTSAYVGAYDVQRSSARAVTTLSGSQSGEISLTRVGEAAMLTMLTAAAGAVESLPWQGHKVVDR